MIDRTPRGPRGTRAAGGVLRLAGLAALVAAGLAARPAEAGLAIDAKTVSNGGIGTTASYNNGGGTSFGVETLAGTFTTTFVSSSIHGPAGSTFTTYCVDLGTTLNSGTVVTAQVSATAVGALADGMGAARDIGAAGWIFNSFATRSLGQLKTFSGLTSLTKQQAEAALQMAIWEAAYDSSGQAGDAAGLDYLGTGALTFSGTAYSTSNVRTLANRMLFERAGRTSVVGLVDYPPIVGGAQSPRNQDQLFSAVAVVPEPSTLAMAAVVGLLGLVGLGRRHLVRPGRRP